MTRNTARLALMLASLELSDQQIRKLLQDLRNSAVEDLLLQVRILRDASLSSTLDDSNTDTVFENVYEPSRDTTIGERVERLLRRDARLTTTQAVIELSELLVESGLIPRVEIPPLSKKSLRVWIDRVVERAPAKEVLRLATILRNRYVHDVTPDWSLHKTTE